MFTVQQSLNKSDLLLSDDSTKLATLCNSTVLTVPREGKDKRDCRRKWTVSSGGELMEEKDNHGDRGEDRATIR